MKKEKMRFKLPHTIVVLFCLVVIVTIFTFIIPAGQYAQITNEAGKSVIDPNGFAYIEQTPVSPLKIGWYISSALKNSAAIIFMVVCACAGVQVVIDTGALETAIRNMIDKFKNKEVILILVTLFTLGTLGFVQNAVSMAGLVPVMILLARACGYDAMTGIALILLGAGGSYSVGPFSANITGTAQTLAGLQVFSGSGYRIFCSYIMVTVSAFFILKYAKSVKANPEKSIVYDLECRELRNGASIEKTASLTTRQKLVLGVFVGFYAVLVYGIKKYSWGNTDIGGMFIWLAIVAGLVGGMTPSRIAISFCDGAKKMMTNCIIIGVASSISAIMKDGMVIDTIVHSLTSVLNVVPGMLQPIAMYIINCLINFFIPSGSGQAAATMPILVPVADLLGISRQICVLAFNFGDGLSNYIFPTSSTLMAICDAAGITYDKWMKFMWKVFLGWSATVCILLIVAQLINYV